MVKNLKLALSRYNGDIFFVVEDDAKSKEFDFSQFNPREVVLYNKYTGPNIRQGIGYLGYLMAYGWSHCYPLIEKYEAIDLERYNLIYKTRPDLYLRYFIPNSLPIDTDLPIVYGRTIGLYNTDHLKEKAIKDCFNIVTRPACHVFFELFFLKHKTRNYFPPLPNEGILGYLLSKENVFKGVHNMTRQIIRDNTEERDLPKFTYNDLTVNEIDYTVKN